MIESENFEKVISFDSGQFAILDAEIVKGFKDKIPEGAVVFVPTKASRGQEVSFKVTGVYDDAILRELKIEPASADSSSSDHEDHMEENIQIRGKGGGDPVKRKISQIDRKAQGVVPKKADRATRNKGDSAKGDPKTKITTTPGQELQARIVQKRSIKGAKRDNYGQPTSKVDNECMEFLQRIKDKVVTEEYLDSLEHFGEIKRCLIELRHEQSSNFDLIYEAVAVMEDHEVRLPEERVKLILRLVEQLAVRRNVDV